MGDFSKFTRVSIKDHGKWREIHQTGDQWIVANYPNFVGWYESDNVIEKCDYHIYFSSGAVDFYFKDSKAAVHFKLAFDRKAQ